MPTRYSLELRYLVHGSRSHLARPLRHHDLRHVDGKHHLRRHLHRLLLFFPGSLFLQKRKVTIIVAVRNIG